MPYDVVTLGEAMVRLAPPHFQRLEQARTLDVEIGGAELNTAVGLSRLGRSAAWVSRLPDNPLGKLIANRVREARRQLGDRVLLGAGTVLDPETARTALLAGAEFVVAPTVNPGVIRLCRRYDKVVMPGAYTPTEILTAWEAGADVVKVFPADVLGPTFFRAMRGPLPQVRLMPTGGVDLTTAAEFLNAGAACLGVGSQLVDPKAVAARQFDRITETAREFVELVQKTRGG